MSQPITKDPDSPLCKQMLLIHQALEAKYGTEVQTRFPHVDLSQESGEESKSEMVAKRALILHGKEVDIMNTSNWQFRNNSITLLYLYCPRWMVIFRTSRWIFAKTKEKILQTAFDVLLGG
jgi:hypothetical protein